MFTPSTSMRAVLLRALEGLLCGAISDGRTAALASVADTQVRALAHQMAGAVDDQRARWVEEME